MTRPKGWFISKFLKNRFNVQDNSIVIFSEARGGSTWLLEMLRNIPGTLVNWESLHKNKGVVPVNYNWGWNPYIPEDDKSPQYISVMSDILRFSRFSDWTIKHVSLRDLINSKFVLTKFVRANLLVPWILNNFTFSHPPIFLLRHPIDTCVSQLKAFNTRPFSIPDCINNERYIKYFDFINQLPIELERKIAIWCINNMKTLNNSKAMKKSILVFYEDLFVYPQQEMGRVIDELNLICDYSRLIQGIDFRRPSTTNYNGDLRAPSEQLYKNISCIEVKTRDSIQEIFNLFGLKLYDAYSPYPKKESLLDTPVKSCTDGWEAQD